MSISTLRIEHHEDQSVSLRARQLHQSVVTQVDLAELAGLGHRHQFPARRVGPRVVRAADPLADLTRTLEQTRPAMRTGVQEGLDRPVLLTHQHYRHIEQHLGAIRPRTRQLAGRRRHQRHRVHQRPLRSSQLRIQVLTGGYDPHPIGVGVRGARPDMLDMAQSQRSPRLGRQITGTHCGLDRHARRRYRHPVPSSIVVLTVGRHGRLALTAPSH